MNRMIIRRITKTRSQGRRLTDNKLKTKQNIHVTYRPPPGRRVSLHSSSTREGVGHPRGQCGTIYLAWQGRPPGRVRGIRRPWRVRGIKSGGHGGSGESVASTRPLWSWLYSPPPPQKNFFNYWGRYSQGDNREVRVLGGVLWAPGKEQALERTLWAPGPERALWAPGKERALEWILWAPGTERALEWTLWAPGTEWALERTLWAPGTERALEWTPWAPGTERALESILKRTLDARTCPHNLSVVLGAH